MSNQIQLDGTRFGSLSVSTLDVIDFPLGLIGFERCHRWVLLADNENSSVGWLQSIDRPELAMSVVSPRRYVTGYRVRVQTQQLERLQLADRDRTYVLAVVAKHEHGNTINLKAPLLINLDQRLGVQVVTRDDQPVQLAFPPSSAQLRAA